MDYNNIFFCYFIREEKKDEDPEPSTIPIIKVRKAQQLTSILKNRTRIKINSSRNKRIR